MSKDNFEQKLPVFNAIPADEVKTPNIPVDNVLQEAENLYVWATHDKNDLVNNSGLAWDSYAEELPVRAGALRHAQSVWVSERYGRKKPIKPGKKNLQKLMTLEMIC
ncbi:hypothetical protein [Aquimarina algiphila]|nr:hypothetical protein [Aquimarina algiphila]